MESTRRQLKVVPPQAIKPLTQPVKQLSPETPEVQDNENPSNPSKAEPQNKFKIPLNRILILGILAGLGYGIFVPKIPYNVKADANVSTQDYRRAIISLPEAGTIKEIKVKPNQDVSAGDVIIEAESEGIKEEIARKKAELGQLKTELQNALIAIDQAQFNLNQERVKTQSARQEVAQAEKDLREFNAGILPQYRQIEAENIGLKSQIATKKQELEILEQRLNRYQKITEQGAIPKNTYEDTNREKKRLLGDIVLMNSRIQQNETQILSGSKQLKDQLQKLVLRLQEQQSQEKSASDNLSSLQKRIKQSTERITLQEAEIKRQEERQKNLIVKTEVPGIVLTLNLDQIKNRFYQAGEAVLEIADLSNLKVISSVREEDVDLLEVGDEVKFYRKGKLEPYTARVEIIPNAPTKRANDPKLYWDVTFSIENDSQRTLKPEMTGYVSIQTQPMTLFEKMRHEVLKLVRQPIL